MSIKFVNEKVDDGVVPVHATLVIDGDGDLNLLLNGEKVLYIESDSGAAYKYALDSSTGQRLGLKIVDNEIEVR